ncbi:metallophosphoesterase family protein [candidate division KSB1 bacterium]|nr:metallophosphoesterase family protein [candidate division KSB1 bacterium]
MYKIGIISDTHGVLPAKVFELFDNVDRIIHAGDIGHERILRQLHFIAPVDAVRGNMDMSPFAEKLPERLDFHLDGFDFIVTHIPGHLFTADKPTIQINGHTHRPCVRQKDQCMTINPGSASRPPGSSPPSVAMLVLAKTAEAHAEILYF